MQRSATCRQVTFQPDILLLDISYIRLLFSIFLFAIPGVQNTFSRASCPVNGDTLEAGSPCSDIQPLHIFHSRFVREVDRAADACVDMALPYCLHGNPVFDRDIGRCYEILR